MVSPSQDEDFGMANNIFLGGSYCLNIILVLTKKVQYSPQTIQSQCTLLLLWSFPQLAELIFMVFVIYTSLKKLIIQCFVTFYVSSWFLKTCVTLQVWMFLPIPPRLWPSRAVSMTVTFTRSGYSGYEECWAVDRKGNRNCFWTDVNCKIFCVTWFQLF